MDASGMIHDARDVAMASEQKGNKSVIEPIHDSKISDDIELCKKLLASIERTVPPPVDNWRWDASGRGGSLLGCVMLEVRWSLAAGTLYRVLSDGFTIGCALIVRELLRWMMENAVVVIWSSLRQLRHLLLRIRWRLVVQHVPKPGAVHGFSKLTERPAHVGKEITMGRCE